MKDLFHAHVLVSTLETLVLKPVAIVIRVSILDLVLRQTPVHIHVIVQEHTVEPTAEQVFATKTLVSMVVHALRAMILLTTHVNVSQAIQVKVKLFFILNFLNFKTILEKVMSVKTRPVIQRPAKTAANAI